MVSSCGGGLYTTESSTPFLDTSPAVDTTRTFSLGSDYPAGLVIPDFPETNHIAFVVSVDHPVGLLAIDLDQTPLHLSTTFAGCLLPAHTGLPTGAVQFVSATRAVLLTSTHLIDCNPRSGVINAALPITAPITLAHPAALSRSFDVTGDGVPDTSVQKFTPSYPSDLAVANQRVYLSFSNYLLPTGNPVAAPGVLLQWELLPAAPFLRPATTAPIITSHFNPTSLRLIGTHLLAIGMSGVTRIQQSTTQAVTDAAVDLLDLASLDRETIGLGPVALAGRQMLPSHDGQILFLASAAYGDVYVIDLATNTVLRDHQHPMAITSGSRATDYLAAVNLTSFGHFLLVGSFATSAIYPVQIAPPDVFSVLPADHSTPIVLGHAAGVTADNPSGTDTGIGAIACRPGTMGVDFAGPDCFALTANPGTLIGFTIGDHADLPASTIAPTVPPVPQTPTTPVSPLTPSAPPPVESLPAPGTPLPVPITTLPPKPSADELVDPAANDPRAFADAVTKLQLGPSGGHGGPGKLCAGNAPCYPGNVLGPPQAGPSPYEPNSQPSAVLELGCTGNIILEMQDLWIADGPGPDFIVFENAFYFPPPSGTHIFAEPGIVGVSLDGITFHDFPCGTEAQGFAGCAGLHLTWARAGNGIDPTDPNVAGGDAFDLNAIGMPYARFVRIRDKQCAGGAGAFDLDAVSIVWGMLPKI